MGLISWAFGKKPEASDPSPSSLMTKPDKLDSDVTISSGDAIPKMVSTSTDNDDDVLSVVTDSSDERNYLVAQSSSITQASVSRHLHRAALTDIQARGAADTTDLIASSSSCSTAELFGGDDTDFLVDFLEERSVALKYQRRKESSGDNGKVSVSLEIHKPYSEDGAYPEDISEEDEEPEGGMDVRESPTFDLNPQDSVAQSTFSKSTTSEEDEHYDFPREEEHTNADEDKQNEQLNVVKKQTLLVEEQAAAVHKSCAHVAPTPSHKPDANLNWADLDEDDDDWEVPLAWRAARAYRKPDVFEKDEEGIELYVQYNAQADAADFADSEEDCDTDTTKRPIDETSLGAEQDSVSSEAGKSSSQSTPSISDCGAGIPGPDNGEGIGDFKQSPVDETSEESGEELQSANSGTACSHYPSSESDYGAGYAGPSRSLAYHNYADVVQAYRNEEDRRDLEEVSKEAYRMQMQQLWERYAEQINVLKAPSASEPQEKDLHDEVMRIVFSEVYPALSSNADCGQMHVIDWKTLMGPDHLGPDPDDEDKFLLHFAMPRLCDVVATLLFDSDPSALDAWLDESKSVVEWWHTPHRSHPGVFRTVIRKEKNQVIVGTYTDLGFSVCWDRYIKATIEKNGQWTESFAFKGGQFKKNPDEKNPGASSRKVRGGIDWESFEIGNPGKYDWDELEDPVEALWHGRMLARELLRTILNNYNQYRGGNTIELVVDGELTPIEARGIRRVTRFDGIENDRIEAVVSCPGMHAQI
ncbi:hypothetical protein SLS60_001556 [Paraconiothyrium brasiliense]|uniref:Uncharacterized protein n=1 Tax=Paraconiothyrium brasiliense TaxID=300254 RepID=A0ABR3RZP2_9PLEO